MLHGLGIIRVPPQTGSGSKGYSSGADATKTRDTACNGCGGEPAHCDSATRNTRETPRFCCSNKDLITAVILGTDFLQLHGLVLDFTTTPVTGAPSKLSANQESAPPIKPIWTAERLFKTKKCPVASIGETMEDANRRVRNPSLGLRVP